MNMVRCENGHFYDSETNNNCPFCNNMSNTQGLTPTQAGVFFPGTSEITKNEPVGKTSAMSNQDASIPTTAPMSKGIDFPHTSPLIKNTVRNNDAVNNTVPKTSPLSSIPKTEPLSPIPKTMPLSGVSDIEKTAPLISGATGTSHALGWLVCINGAKQGKDYRIITEKCYIGRNQSNDICLDFDKTISRDSHLIIMFNRVKNEFWLDASQSKDCVYMNKELVMSPVCLKYGDSFTIGETTLIFVPLCGEKFSWFGGKEAK